jgi:diaminopimelate epimerase
MVHTFAQINYRSTKMGVRFTKMHGLGNDFVLVDCRENNPGNWTDLAARMGHRRFGVGFDQALLLKNPNNPDKADFRMEILNSDGSLVEMCGNGIRCFAYYLKNRLGFDESAIRIETMGGLQVCRFLIPLAAEGKVREYPLELPGADAVVTCVSMGNPHAVIFVEEVESYPVEEMGPRVETHEFFPNKINTEFVEVLSRDKLRMRVWERGAGLTMACGTGACAAAVAAYWTGRSEREVEVVLDGGSLFIRWDAETNHVFMTGPAVEVFDGVFPG